MIKETEIKIKLTEKEAKEILSSVHVGQMKRQETWQVFSKDGEFEKSGNYLRIRKQREKIELTVKTKKSENKKYFQREERTIEIKSKLEKIIELLKIFGLTEVYYQEKYRTEWQYENTILSLDNTPMGWFLEIEGEKSKIEKVIRDLNLSGNKRVVGAYLKFWIEYAKKKKLNERKMIFE